MSEVPYKEKYVRITSSDKLPSSSHNGDFTIQMPERDILQSVKAITLKEAWVPNVFYNVRSSNGFVNNVFKMKETGQSDISPTVPDGQYNIATLMPALQSSINALLVSGTVAITQDPNTLKITFTFTGTTADNIYDYNDGNLMASLVGITNTIVGPSAVMTSQSLPDLSGITAVFLYSDALALNEMADGDFGLVSSFESVSFNNASFGKYAYKQCSYELVSTITYPSVKNISTIDIQIRDQYGNILNPGVHDIIIVLKLFY